MLMLYTLDENDIRVRKGEIVLVQMTFKHRKNDTFPI